MVACTSQERSHADSETKTADSETNGHADSETKIRKLKPRIRKLRFGNSQTRIRKLRFGNKKQMIRKLRRMGIQKL